MQGFMAVAFGWAGSGGGLREALTHPACDDGRQAVHVCPEKAGGGAECGGGGIGSGNAGVILRGADINELDQRRWMGRLGCRCLAACTVAVDVAAGLATLSR